ncbi:MAG TPA: ATP-binding protein [Thermodesulfovibrionales bacterium]|nr:ATP-binding protein [Thermodesulfovibrionales bacterium]
MKIERKIILSNAVNLVLIAVTGIFAIQNLNSMFTKLRFVEIADDLNATFLEMRLSEKNYFLYRDENALDDIEIKIQNTQKVIISVKNDILRAIGAENVEQLEKYLASYEVAVKEVRKKTVNEWEMEQWLRAAGKNLKEFSDRITRLERTNINEIIQNSKWAVFSSFFAVLLSVFFIGHIVANSIVRRIKVVEEMANSISRGNFTKVEISIPNDETGSVIQAINAMSEELKNREEQVIQSKKLASMGILVAGVAHELNNPLNNISMVAQTYTELYDNLSREQRIEFMGKIEGETERIKGIVKNLLDFAKPKEPNLVMSDMNEIVKKTLKLVQNMLDVSNIETRLNLASELPSVFIDENQIQQVFVNIIVNAIQAMSTGGKLAISTRRGKEEDTVEVSFLDTGKGISQEFLPNIFDPFFSTKEEGGTGLGLWVSYGIVKNHGGNILVESKLGTGTCFIVQLPFYRDKGEHT